MNRIMRNSGAALAAIFIAGSLTACGPGSASSSRSDTNPTEVSTDLGNKKYELTLWDGAGLKAVDEALIAGFEAKYPNITITGQYDPDNVAYRNFCGALDWFSLSVGGVGVSRGGVEFVPVDAGPVCGRDAVVRFGRRCLFALPQGVGDE